MWSSSLLAVLGLILLAVPASRHNDKALTVGAVSIFFSIWMDKGLAFIVAGFIPNSFEKITEYWPAPNELMVAAGVLAVGTLVLTLLYKITVSVKEEQILDAYGERQVKDGSR